MHKQIEVDVIGYETHFDVPVCGALVWEVVERDSYLLKVSFAHEAQARAWCDEQALPVQQAEYDGNGVSLTIGWPRDVELDISGLENRLKTSIELQRT